MYFTLIKSRSGNAGILVSALFALSFYTSVAQVQQPDRYEIALGNNETFFEVVPAEDQGLFLHRRFYSAKQDQLQLIRLDTAFTEVWKGFMPIERNYVIMGRKAFEDKLLFLVRYKDYSKNDLLLYIIESSTGNYTRYTIKGYIPFSPTEFQVTKNAVIIGGYYNRIPVVLHYSLITFRSKVLPGMFNEIGELTQIKPYPNGSFDVLVSALNFKRQRTLFIRTYTEEGDIVTNMALEPEDNKHLIFGRSIKTPGNVQIVAGVYGTRSAEFSRGIFLASIDQSGMQQIRYYNFGDLENFFKYMKAKREQRVKSRIERRKIKGKKIKFNYRFLVHEIVPYKKQFVLLGEAFYPKYITTDRAYSGGFFAYGRYPGSMIQNGRVFDGYRYTHAVVMGFTPEGKLIWDNSFEINDVKTFTLEQFVKLDVDDDKIALLYLFEDKLRTKIIKDDEVLEGKSIDTIRPQFDTDVVTRNKADVSKLEYWYSDFLYAYGVQQIENPTLAKPKRKVFYINKVKQSR